MPGLQNDKSVYLKIIFLISQPKHMLQVLKRTVSMRGFLEHPKHMLKLMGKEIYAILGAQTILIWTYVMHMTDARQIDVQIGIGHLGLVPRKPDSVACQQQRCRPACTDAQSGLHLCYWLSGKYNS